jgi:transposase
VVTDKQVRRLMKLSQEDRNIAIVAAKAGMSENTARKYLRSGELPSQCKKERTWRTREDPFETVWDEIREKLEENPGLEAKTLFEWLQREGPGGYSDGQLRTFQRRIKQWRSLEGPAREVYFAQNHRPGK